MKTRITLLIVSLLLFGVNLNAQNQKTENPYVEFGARTYIKRTFHRKDTMERNVLTVIANGKTSVNKWNGLNVRSLNAKSKNSDTIVVKYPRILDPFNMPEINDSNIHVKNILVFLDFSKSTTQLADSLINKFSAKPNTPDKKAEYTLAEAVNSPYYKKLKAALDSSKINLLNSKYLSSIHNTSFVYYINDPYRLMVTKSHSCVVGAGSIPIKVRFRIGDNIPTFGALNIPINAYIGYKYAETRYKGSDRSEFSLIPAVFLGISAEPVGQKNRWDRVDEDFTVPALNYGASIQFGYRSFFIGLGLGLDYPLDKLARKQWIYNNRGHLGVSLGYKLPFFK